MIQKERKEISFADVALAHTEKKWKEHWLNKVLSLIDWSKFRNDLYSLYNENEGRPAWDPVVLFKCLLLAEWYGLSDRRLEEALEFRIDFRKFSGIPFDMEAPDATTFVVFRKRLERIWKKLFKRLNQQIERQGFKVHEAISVDATLVEAHSKPTKKNPAKRGDQEAAWRGFPAKKLKDAEGNEVMARRPALFGYKVNLAASKGTGFVSGFSLCKASEHETHHLLEFISSSTKAVYADKGYAGNRRKLKRRKIRDGIQSKGRRGHPLGRREIERNKRISKHRRIVESVFGSWKRWYGWRKTRFIGLMRNELAVFLTASAWNIKKVMTLS